MAKNINETANAGDFVMLDVSVLRAHPDNPRKDLGDLSELSESIKVNGIMQNLTVIPSEEAGGNAGDSAYTVVIGHRRLAAAKKAGIKEVPCRIAHMDRRKQLSTMIAENVQRNDLTIYEQAQGFQLMFDEGSSISDISDVSGFSRETVKHRLEIAKLDGEKIKGLEADGAQLSLSDFVELEKLDDIVARNDLLEFVGTSNFKWEMNSALRVQKGKKIRAAAEDVLNAFCPSLSTNETCGMTCINIIRTVAEAKALSVPDDEDLKKYKYGAYLSDGNLYIYRKERHSVKKKNDKESKEKAKRQERISKLDALFKNAYELRVNYIKELDVSKLTYGQLVDFMTECCFFYDYCYLLNNVRRIFLPENKRNDCISSGELRAAVRSLSDKRRLLYFGCCLADDSENVTCRDYYGKYSKNDRLYNMYKALEAIGYVMSDEERALLDGTHSAYLRE